MATRVFICRVMARHQNDGDRWALKHSRSVKGPDRKNVTKSIIERSVQAWSEADFRLEAEPQGIDFPMDPATLLHVLLGDKCDGRKWLAGHRH